MYFYQELRSWIITVMRQRKRMIQMGVSHKNNAQMQENINYLKKYLNYYHYESNMTISRFFQTNRSRILSLLPGEGAGGFQKRHDEFSKYDDRTMQILKDIPGSVNDSRQCAFRRPGERLLPSFSSFPD